MRRPPPKKNERDESLVALVPATLVMPCQRRGTTDGPAAAPSGCVTGAPVEGCLASPVGPWAFGMAGHRRPFHPSRL